MFRRFFFVWLSFFICCAIAGQGILLIHRWRAASLLEESKLQALTGACMLDFADQQQLNIPPTQWNWNKLARNWHQGSSVPQGFALVDSVSGMIAYTTGEFSRNWNAIVHDPGDRNVHWVDLDTGERFWTLIPAPETDPQYRFWVALHPIQTFMGFLHEMRWFLGGEFLALIVIFVIFYCWIGSPTHALNPMVSALQKSLESAETIPTIPFHDLPGEFIPLARTLALILETRQQDHLKKTELSSQIDNFSDHKTNYTAIIQQLQSRRDDDQTMQERLQSTLLEANREPAMVLDRTRRILAMNEPARRILGLGGQTGFSLRHSELDSILDAELAAGSRTAIHRLTTKDLFLGRTQVWRVKIHILHDWRDETQVQLIIIYLTQEQSEPSHAPKNSKDLFFLFSEALHQSWTQSVKGTIPLEQEEKEAAENLIRFLMNYQPATEPLGQVIPLFRIVSDDLDALEEQHLLAGGSRQAWTLFLAWFEILLSKMLGFRIQPRLKGFGEGVLSIEWSCTHPFPFNDWLLTGNDPSRVFRRELLQQSLERLGAKLIWHPSTPMRMSLEIALKRSV